MSSYARGLRTRVLEALSDRPVVTVIGPRQCGKTTLARQIAGELTDFEYLTLDDATTRAAARADPDGFLAARSGPVAIDEVQAAPDLLRAIKLRVDRHRVPGRYLLTGSANVFSLPTVSESLAGRMEILRLGPLTRREVVAAPGNVVDELFRESPFQVTEVDFCCTDCGRAGVRRADTKRDTMSRPYCAKCRRDIRVDDPDVLLGHVAGGGYPEALASATRSRRAEWFRSYETSMLHVDLRDIARVPDVSSVPRLLRCIAARSARLANFADLARDAALNHMTAKRHFGHLEALFLVQQIPAWARNATKRHAKAPKLLLADSGLAAHLLNASPDRLRDDPALRGALVETFVIGEILRQAAWSERRPAAHHYRTHDGDEVDLVLEDDDGSVVGVEVKSAGSVGASDLRGMRALQNETKKLFRGGVVFYQGRTIVPFAPNIVAVPIPALWAALR